MLFCAEDLLLEVVWGDRHGELLVVSRSVVGLPFTWLVLVRWERHASEGIEWHTMGWQHVWWHMATLLVEGVQMWWQTHRSRVHLACGQRKIMVHGVVAHEVIFVLALQMFLFLLILLGLVL